MTRRLTAFFLFNLALAAATAAPLRAADPPSDATKRTRLAADAEPAMPANPSQQSLDPDEVDKNPAASFGEQMRLTTPITEAEVTAADPSFRAWVDAIRAGRADKPTMRLYAYFR